MSKVLNASCKEGILTVDGVPVQGAIILSEGVGESEGIACIDERKIFYIAKTTPDLARTLDNLSEALAAATDGLKEIATALTGIGNSMTGSSTAKPPQLDTWVSNIGDFADAIDSAKEDLDELKGVLR